MYGPRVCVLTRPTQQQIVNCSSTWTKDMVSGKPYLCVAGMDAKVKICDVKEGTFVRVRRGPLTPFLPPRC